MPITDVFAAVAVNNLEAAKDWYAQLFGRPVDVEPMPTLAQWNTQPSGGVQVVLDEQHSGTSMVTIGVQDLDAMLAELAQRGLATSEVIDGVISRVTQLRDPAGNTVTLAELHHKP